VSGKDSDELVTVSGRGSSSDRSSDAILHRCETCGWEWEWFGDVPPEKCPNCSTLIKIGPGQGEPSSLTGGALSSEGHTAGADDAMFHFSVVKTGHWPFAWGFAVYRGDEFVYGEKNIESRRAATKDAEDIVARLSDGRLSIADSGVVYATL